MKRLELWALFKHNAWRCLMCNHAGFCETVCPENVFEKPCSSTIPEDFLASLKSPEDLTLQNLSVKRRIPRL